MAPRSSASSPRAKTALTCISSPKVTSRRAPRRVSRTCTSTTLETAFIATLVPATKQKRTRRRGIGGDSADWTGARPEPEERAPGTLVRAATRFA